MQSTNNLAKKP